MAGFTVGHTSFTPYESRPAQPPTRGWEMDQHAKLARLVAARLGVSTQELLSDPEKHVARLTYGESR